MIIINERNLRTGCLITVYAINLALVLSLARSAFIKAHFYRLLGLFVFLCCKSNQVAGFTRQRLDEENQSVISIQRSYVS